MTILSSQSIVKVLLKSVSLHLTYKEVQIVDVLTCYYYRKSHLLNVVAMLIVITLAKPRVFVRVAPGSKENVYQFIKYD